MGRIKFRWDVHKIIVLSTVEFYKQFIALNLLLNFEQLIKDFFHIRGFGGMMSVADNPEDLQIMTAKIRNIVKGTYEGEYFGKSKI